MATLTITQASCADDYDPNSMPVAKAREFIHRFLQPVDAVLRVPVRSALGRVLAEDVLSPVDVPAHRNSAMDGWAMRGADLKPEGETTLEEIGSSFAGRPFRGEVGPGQCVRIMTGGVVPRGADTVVMQERARASGKSVSF
jgi:molybdopterin molybdotransferase